MRPRSGRHLALLGSGPQTLELVHQLLETKWFVTLIPEPEALAATVVNTDVVLVLGEVADEAELQALAPQVKKTGLPWLALCGSEASPSLTASAYRAGALSVLPPGAPAEVIRQAVEQTLASLQPSGGRFIAERAGRRRYRTGDAVPLAGDEMLSVLEGVVAQFALHEDGTEVLLGLWGPDQLIAGHPQDACCLSLRAHTQLTVQVGSVTDLATQPKSLDSLLERLMRLEAWSSMQARQSVEQRLMGVLSLLAEQFGRSRPEGIVIEVRVTHALLAAAIGATRTTVTRILGSLKRRGLVAVVESEGGERLCLPQWNEGGHRVELSFSHSGVSTGGLR